MDEANCLACVHHLGKAPNKGKCAMFGFGVDNEPNWAPRCRYFKRGNKDLREFI